MWSFLKARRGNSRKEAELRLAGALPAQRLGWIEGQTAILPPPWPPPRTRAANGQRQHFRQRMGNPPRHAKTGHPGTMLLKTGDTRPLDGKRYHGGLRIDHGTQKNHALCQSLSAVNPNAMACLDLTLPCTHAFPLRLSSQCRHLRHHPCRRELIYARATFKKSSTGRSSSCYTSVSGSAMC
jgi:hypothetical protein